MWARVKDGGAKQPAVCLSFFDGLANVRWFVVCDK